MKKHNSIVRSIGLALTLFTVLPAQASFVKAQEYLAEEDHKKALNAFLQSAKLGHADSQFNAAVIYFQGLSGEKDLIKSFSWMALANEYQFPNSETFAQEIYASIPAEQQEKAIEYATELVKNYGRQITEAKKLPKIEKSPIAAQVIVTPAEMVKRGQLTYSGTSSTIAKNEALIRAAIRNGNPDIFYKQVQNLDAGMVEVQFDVGTDGKAKDWDVLFSWPNNKFVEGTLNAIKESKYTPAKNEFTSVTQYGLTYHASFGQTGVNDFRQGYPHIYKTFRSVRRMANDGNPNAKHTYAKLLRAYKHILDKENYEDFEAVLKEAAELGQLDAQYDYAMLNIYVNRQAELGLPWLIKAAKAGHIQAQGRLGELLLEPPTAYIEQDLTKAKFWLELAANQNDFRAQQKYIEMELLNNNNQDKEFAKQALDWLEDIEDDGEPTPFTYFLLAKVNEILDDKGDAKDWMKDAIASAKQLGWATKDWQAYQESLNN
ncbi:TonB family protein [Catenovulum agarivorans DS-2]|uniref:TonB family protein n=1 Tax=Catenovulum agarivorans DS-2 TaxID=1328313 RepID=W7Q694_9ALTE|nr:energy transducer TonB [Catenovulum agarivorans]EWH08279.1 TonB family protein [Catenovulum agarivorans DS-2]